MKPIKLKICGLQSFREEQEVDFARLSYGGMFGIFGKTGSGKSTILDAMTLALYGEVGRGQGRGKKNGIINEKEDSASVSLEFSIGSGADSKRYRVERKYKKDKDNITKPVTIRLMETPLAGDATVLADSEESVTQKVTTLLGITADDFVRAVVLPQGKFAEFLMLKADQRRAMLERLFKLGKFGEQLGSKLKKCRAEISERENKLDGELNGLGDASREAVAAKEDQAGLAVFAAKQAEEIFVAAKAAYEESKIVHELQGKLLESQQTLDRHSSSDEAVAELERTVQQAEKAAQVEPYMKQTKAFQREYDSDFKAAGQEHEKEKAAKAAAEAAKAALDDVQKVHREKGPELNSKKEKMQSAINLEKQLKEKREQLASLDDQLNKIEADMKALTDTQTAATERLREAKDKLDTTRNELNECQVTIAERETSQDAAKRIDVYESAVAKLKEGETEQIRRNDRLKLTEEEYQSCLQLQKSIWEKKLQTEEKLQALNAGVPVDEVRLTEEASRLKRCEEDFNDIKQWQMDLDVANGKIDRLNRDLEKSVNDKKAAEIAAGWAAEELNKARQDYQDAIQNDRRRMATILAEGLKEGCPCPVCGALHHLELANDTGAESTEEMDRLKSAVAERETAQKTAEATCKQIGEISTQLAIQINGEMTSRDNRSKQMTEMCAKICRELASENAAMDLAASDQAIVHEKRRLASQQTSLMAWKKEIETCQNTLEELKNDERKNDGEVAALTQKKTHDSEDAAKNEQNLILLKGEVDSAADQVKKAATSLDTSEDGTISDHIAFIRANIANIAAKDKMNEALTKSRQQFENDIKELDGRCAEVQQRIQGMQREYSEQKSIRDTAQVLYNKDEDQLAQVTGGASAEAELKRAEEELSMLQQQEEAAAATWEAAEKQRQGSAQDKASAEAKLEKSWLQLAKAAAELDDVIAANEFGTLAAVKASLLDDELLRQRRKQVKDHQESKIRLTTERNSLKSELNGRSVTEEGWLNSQQNLQTAEQESKDKTQEAIELTQTWRGLAAKHQRWNQLHEELERVRHESDTISRLAKLTEGKKMVDFVAAEQMEDVVRRASERLKQLTHNRYALELGSDGSFFIRDDGNGGGKRSASSLSGGETFQTSLALALALSDQIYLRGKYPLEFFFLDEGFGSLDRETLDASMATLERLRQKSPLTIGIISHVEELQQRMPLRLMVTPPDLLGHGSLVSIEQA